MRRIMMGLVTLTGCGEPMAAEAPGDPFTTGTDGAAANGRVAAPATGGGMQTVQVVNRLGFGRPIVATSVSVPAGWRTEGGVNWDDSTPCATSRMKFMWRAVAPDGIAALEMMPGFTWLSPGGQMQFNPCPVSPMSSARELLTAAARSMRPNAQMVGYRRRDDLMQQARASDRSGTRTDIGELRLRYTLRGVPVDEVLYVAVALSSNGGAAGYILGWRARQGQLDLAAFDRLRATFVPNRAYIAAIGQRGNQAIQAHAAQQSAAISAWHNSRMAEINARGAADRAAIRARGNAETNAIYADTYAGTQATNARMHDRNMGAIREEQRWSDPSTGQSVQGSIHGPQRVIRNPNGSYTRTDDPYYSPPGGTEMTPD
jgi:hypothetical protein